MLFKRTFYSKLDYETVDEFKKYICITLVVIDFRRQKKMLFQLNGVILIFFSNNFRKNILLLNGISLANTRLFLKKNL